MKKISKNEKETLEFAEKFAHKLRGGEVIGLIGELGAGKTVFVKGLARGLGIRQIIHSPTFLLMKIYKVKSEKLKVKSLIHVDAYRLMGADELIDVGLLDWLGRKNVVTVIEWADKVKELLRGRKVIKINFKLGEKENERIIKVTRK
jgi:tRNA threonylcarbamoyladenosine biosynthesis protein TsaE